MSEFKFDVEAEMNEYFDMYMEDLITKFKRQPDHIKFKVMKQMRAQIDDFLEYYEHYEDDVAE